MSRALSIAHVVAPAEVGGLESVLHLLSSSQRARGHDVQVVAVVPRPGFAAVRLAELERAGVPVTPIISRGRDYAGEWAAVKRTLQRLGPDIAHTHGYRADVIAGHAARYAGIPTVTTVHGFTGGDWKNRLYERIQVRSFRAFEAVVAVSRPMCDQLSERGVRANRLHVVPNAYASASELLPRSAARAALGVPYDAFCIGWIGRFSREKGADVLLDALPLLREQARVVMIGDGAERTALEARARRLGIGEMIRWTGVRHDAPQLLRAFDCLVLSSRTEGTPMVLLEAMMARVPVVATRVGGIPDVVTDVQALLVPPEHPASIAEAIETVRNDPAAAQLRAAWAHARLAERYAIDPWVAAYDDIYGAVLGERAGRAA